MPFIQQNYKYRWQFFTNAKFSIWAWVLIYDDLLVTQCVSALNCFKIDLWPYSYKMIEKWSPRKNCTQIEWGTQYSLKKAKLAQNGAQQLQLKAKRCAQYNGTVKTNKINRCTYEQKTRRFECSFVFLSKSFQWEVCEVNCCWCVSFMLEK